MKGNFKNILLIIRVTPFNTIALPEALRMAVGLTMSDNRVSIVLIDDGAWNVLNLAPNMIERPDIHESMNLFSACGVRIMAEEISLKERDISEHGDQIEKISRKEVFKLIECSDVVMNFK